MARRAVNSDKLREWLEIVGIVAVVASLVFVGLEVRQSSEAAKEEALSNDLSNMIAVDELVAASPGIWLRGCKGEMLEDDEQVVFTRIFNAVQFTHFLRWVRSNRGVGVSRADLTIDNMAMNLYRNPGLMTEWNRHWPLRHQVADDNDLHIWRDAVNKRVAEFPSFEPEPINEPFRCGLN